MTLFTFTWTVLLAANAVLLRFVYLQWQQSKLLSEYPWIGIEGKLLFSRSRARVENLLRFKETIQTAYEKYSLNQRTFVLPTPSATLILLPPSEIPWLAGQPDDVLSSRAPHIHALQSDYTFSHPHILRSPAHHLVISRDLTRSLGVITEDIVDEIRHATHLLWPHDENEFKDVHVFGTLMNVVARTTNRIFVGRSLCRDKEYLRNVTGFAQEVPKCGAILRQFPAFARPLVSKMLLKKNREYMRNFCAITRPEIEKRQPSSADPEKGNPTDYNDLLQWLVDRGEELGGIERDPDIIAGRLIAVNFAANHTSVFSITNVIFDLVSSPPEAHYIEQLREEVESVLAQTNGLWTKAGLAKMHKIDSALRESSRIGSFLGPGMTRTVMVKQGVTSPNGTFCPYGSSLAVATVGIHNDPTNYTDPATFDPFRFSKLRHREATTRPVTPEQGESSDDYVNRANLAFVSTSPTYHPFGHGRHACPGRFFAANVLKVLLAYLVLNFDFEPLAQRPESKWMGPVLVPPMKSSIRVRPRKRG